MSVSRVVAPLAAVASLLFSASAFAQSPAPAPAPIKYHEAKRLGGATSFLARRPLTDAASLKRMVTPGMASDIRRVLREAELQDIVGRKTRVAIDADIGHFQDLALTPVAHPPPSHA